MLEKLYAVFDMKAQVYGQVFQHRSRMEALRAFMNAANDPEQGLLHKYPEDFILFELGTYNKENGKIESHESPFSLGSALDAQNARKPLESVKAAQ